MAQQTLLISDTQEYAQILEPALFQEGFSIALESKPEDKRHLDLAERGVALIIIAVQKPSINLLETQYALTKNHPVPVIMFVKESDKDFARLATQAGVCAYIVDGLREARIGTILTAALTRFAERQNLQQALDKATATLKERKIVERAKGLLMQQRGCSEDEAYNSLRKLAMQRNRRLIDIAEGIIDAQLLMN